MSKQDKQDKQDKHPKGLSTPDLSWDMAIDWGDIDLSWEPLSMDWGELDLDWEKPKNKKGGDNG